MLRIEESFGSQGYYYMQVKYLDPVIAAHLIYLYMLFKHSISFYCKLSI